MKRLAILAIVAGCAAPKRRAAEPGLGIPCEICGTNGTSLAGLRGGHAPSTIQVVDLPGGAR
jgi:hypothetical protein